jgi:sarcosine oxidase subunit beta
MSTNGTRTADYIILGAGVMGASIAFHLAQRKAGRILVIDKDHVGRGGSGRSSALIRMHYSFPAEVQLALVSLRMFERWGDLVGESSLFHKTGFVRIVHPNETERLKLNVEMQRGLGVNVRLISRKELQDREPDWVLDDVELAAYEPDSGYGDGAGVANDFLARARFRSWLLATNRGRRVSHRGRSHPGREDGSGRYRRGGGGGRHRSVDPPAIQQGWL